ncbi:MAG: hypothetical protein ACD_16C00230G0002 [uncultured bacterium]|nr:MAG: hypothetical protein ACD_16C00230G0002 [uncultured bacterium]OFW68975.1 MAG: hypothetical protein A2X70_00520 [Alphaproteobacteria bacterium GWC2_42_16]OFW73807.1 MAG: hypothetical protein A2Z80_05770 [Alphaproteobacteria bacterium GWA2_41_27]OFW82089.1 MAG: hypothetical protein A3E50_06580 [Alphaproteobacteria bacterium RIFCSPHIGHO2_12_FULL_42_100]OFW86334.1 MAG: hypothetical protein A2W06_03270 [Alphaproteobacteria bacterium RBG_16_42_14]OFW91230.1 MAG: hypothetical protein A3C41_062
MHKLAKWMEKMKNINLSLNALIIGTSLLIGASMSTSVKAFEITNNSEQDVTCKIVNGANNKRIGDPFELPAENSRTYQCDPGKSACSQILGCILHCHAKNDSTIAGKANFNCMAGSSPNACTITDTTVQGEHELSIDCPHI